MDGINPYVDVPEQVVEVLGAGTKAAVLANVAAREALEKENSVAGSTPRPKQDAARLERIGRLAPGGWFRTTLVPLRAEPTRLYLHTWMREAAGVNAT